MQSFTILRFRRAVEDLVDAARGHIPAATISVAGSALGLPLVKVLAGADVKEEALLLIAYGILGPIALLVLSFGLFYILAGRRLYFDAASQIKYYENANKTSRSTNDGNWEIYNPAIHDRHPNWTIRELFYHIRPDLLEDPDSMDWIEVGQEVKDAFSLGRLHVWGREKQDWVDEITGTRHSPTEIMQHYWEKSEFTYWFLAEGKEFSDHTQPPRDSHLPVYQDLRVNKREALRIWPTKPEPPESQEPQGTPEETQR